MPAKRAIVLIAAVLVGAAAACLLLPFALRLDPDTARLQAILHACRTQHPRIVILGNSTGMYGVVDAQQLGPHTFNFCTPAQPLSESLLLARELPASTRVVVQFVTFWQLEDEETVLTELPLRERRNVRVALESLVRRDRPASGKFAELERNRAFAPRQLTLLRAIAVNKRVLFVLAPVHPRVRAARPQLLPQFRAAVASTNASVLDLTELLDATEFLDATHATRDGAHKITRSIGARIAIE